MLVATSQVFRIQGLLCEMVKRVICLEEERVSGWLRLDQVQERTGLAGQKTIYIIARSHLDVVES